MNHVRELFCPYCTYGLVGENQVFHSVKRALNHVAKCRPILQPSEQLKIGGKGSLTIISVKTSETLDALVKLLNFAHFESPEASFKVGNIDSLKEPCLPFVFYALVDNKSHVVGFANYYLELEGVPAAKLMQTYIRREIRGKGYGKFLLESTIREICATYNPLCFYYDIATDAGYRVWSALPFQHSGKMIDVSELTWSKHERSVLQEYCRRIADVNTSGDVKKSVECLRQRMESVPDKKETD